MSGAFPLGDGQGAAKILDVQALLAETFARRIRADHPNAARSVIATHAPEAAAEARETFVTFDVAGQEFALDLGPRSGDHRAARRHCGRAARRQVGRGHDGASRALASPDFNARIARLRARPNFGSAREDHRRVRWRRAGRSHRRSRSRRHRRRPGADRSRAARDSGPFGRRSSHQIDLSRRGRSTAGLDP